MQLWVCVAFTIVPLVGFFVWRPWMINRLDNNAITTQKQWEKEFDRGDLFFFPAFVICVGFHVAMLRSGPGWFYIHYWYLIICAGLWFKFNFWLSDFRQKKFYEHLGSNKKDDTDQISAAVSFEMNPTADSWQSETNPAAKIEKQLQRLEDGLMQSWTKSKESLRLIQHPQNRELAMKRLESQGSNLTTVANFLQETATTVSSVIDGSDEIMAKLVIEPADYYDKNMTTKAAIFTSRPYKNIMAKYNARDEIKWNTCGVMIWLMPFFWTLPENCPGFDGQPHPEYLPNHHIIWGFCLPELLLYIGRLAAYFYFGVLHQSNGSFWKAEVFPQIACTSLVCLINLAFAVFPPLTMAEKEATCMISTNNTDNWITFTAQSMVGSTQQGQYYGDRFSTFASIAGGVFTIGLLLELGNSLQYLCGMMVIGFAALGVGITMCVGAGNVTVNGAHIMGVLFLFIGVSFPPQAILTYIEHLNKKALFSRKLQDDRMRYDHQFELLQLEESDDIAKFDQLCNSISDPDSEMMSFFGVSKREIRQIDPAANMRGRFMQRSTMQAQIADRFSIYTRAVDVNDAFQQHANDNWCAPYGGTHHASPVKSVWRAYEKTERSYSGEFARLCDIVRTTCVFPNMAALSKAADAMHKDNEIRILKVKNRFSVHWRDDPSLQTGYRDACFLIYGKKLTAGLICECQLNLEPTFAIKSNEGHKLYKLARDALGA